MAAKKINKCTYRQLRNTICIGIDASISNTAVVGVVFNHKGKVKIRRKELSYNKEYGKGSAYTKESITRIDKAHRLLQDVADFIDHVYLHSQESFSGYVKFIVTIEGYSFGSRGRAAIHLGEYGGILRLVLAKWKDRALTKFGLVEKVTIGEVPPTDVKKLLLGKGNAGKEESIAFLKKATGIEAVDDVADAFGAAMYFPIKMGYVRDYEKWRG